MANWASVSYRIEGEEKDLQELYNIIERFISNEREPWENSASEWVGNVILDLGINKKDTYLRSFIQTFSLKDGVLSIECEEAWGTSDFRYLIEDHYDNMKVYYLTEEPGCCVYETNDHEGKYFPYTHIVEHCIDGNCEGEYFNSEEDALKYAAKLLKRDEVTYDEVDAWNLYHEDEGHYININEFQFVD